MRTKLYLKILIGCFVALTALFTILGTVVIAYVKLLQSHLVTVVAAFGLAGLALLFLGRRKVTEPGATVADANEEMAAYDAEHPLEFFRRLKFWGSILIVSSLPIYIWSRGLMRAGTHAQTPPVKRPAPAPVAVSPPPEAPAPAPPAQFPILLLRGIVWNGAKSTAVINGQTLRAGDSLDGVKVVTINSNSVCVEAGSATVLLKLE